MKLGKALRSLISRAYVAGPKPLILMYHRVARDPIDVWDLAVSPENFAEQLAVLRRTRSPLSLTDFVRNLVSGTLPSNAVAVTFDDGYVDNLLEGKPRLSAADVPATVFLATGYLDRPGEFWWDELSRLMLTGGGPQYLKLAIGGSAVNVEMAADRLSGCDRRAATFETRRTALMTVWELMRRTDDQERQRVMGIIRSLLTDDDESIERGRAMRREEVRALVSDGLVMVGAHTVTHPLLSHSTVDSRHREIIESKSACEALVGVPVTGFSYPYGDFDSDTRKVVSDANFTYACSTRRAGASSSSDLFALPRIHVRNWNGDDFQRALRPWSVTR